MSSSPLEGRYHLSVLIKVLGEWTEKLKGKISNNEERQKLLETRLKSLITASVEGPYGHESPYHLTYVLCMRYEIRIIYSNFDCYI